MFFWFRSIAVVCLLVGGLSPAFAGLWIETDAVARGDGPARQYLADGAELRRLLALAPDENRGDRSQIIEMPLPDGSLARYSIVESPMLEAGLAERYPDIKTYRLIGIDDSIASGRAMLGAQGFSAMLHTRGGRVVIDPAGLSADAYRVSSRFRHAETPRDVLFRAPLSSADNGAAAASTLAALPAARIGGSLISYRLAVAATDNYVTAVGGTVADAQDEIINTINRVNSIYERDLGIRLVLVANNDSLIEVEDTGCLVNNDAFAILPQNQQWIDGILGRGRYDIGHVFTTDPGGLASLVSVCVANIKAQGTSGHGNPVGDDFYVDIVAHELGHQLGADHSFNGSTGACSGNRNESTAFEPGSGSSIMAYSGLCGDENLQRASDASFHAGSIDQIQFTTENSGSCFTSSTTGNTDPQLTAAADYSIPELTPFLLDNTTATDADGNNLSYQWDQMNVGAETTNLTFGRDNGDNALFRGYPPRTDAFRNFPALGTQLDGFYDKAEVMACSQRALDFRLTVRDNEGGQVADDVTINVIDGAGPFRITAPNGLPIIDSTTDTIAVAWDVAGTDQAPIDCALVDIDLLTFSDPGFTTYSVYNLADDTANDAAETVSIPNTTDDTDYARIRVKCSDNIFYDISNTNLRVDGSGTNAFDSDDVTTYFNDNTFSTLTLAPPLCAAPRPAALAVAREMPNQLFAEPPAQRLAAAGECVIPGVEPKHDSSSFSLGWLASLLLLLGIKGWRGYATDRRAWFAAGHLPA